MLYLAALSSLAIILTGPPSEYDAAAEQVQNASRQANRSESPETVQALADALDVIEQFPTELVADERGREQQLLAQLNLARVYQNVGDVAAAERAMDEAIFAAGGKTLPVQRFGPRVVELHEQRTAALAARGLATLEVRCEVQCSVIVDGNAIAGSSVELPLGSHQVHVGSAVDEDLTTEVELGAEGAVVQYAGKVPPPPVVSEVDTSPSPGPKFVWGPDRPPAKWKLVGVGVSGGLFVVSTGIMIAGVYKLGVNGPIRRELLAAAEDSLTDSKPSNDVDPNTSENLCTQARTPPDPSKPNEVTNGELVVMCNQANTVGTMTNVSMVMMGVTGASTIVFGLLLHTTRAPAGGVAQTLRSHRAGLAIGPRADGGITFAGGFSF